MDRNLCKHILWETKADWQKIAKKLVYNMETGLFYKWYKGRLKPVDRVYNTKDQLVIMIDGRYRLADRIAWNLYYGKVPIGYITHKNNNVRDNRLRNLVFTEITKAAFIRYSNKYKL